MFNYQRFRKSFGFALQGLSFSFKENQNVKVQSIIGVIVLFVSLILGLSKYEIFSVGVLIVLVLSAEMINTAIEEVINLLVNEHRLEAKIAKDVSAGMVLLVSFFALLVGLFIFVPHILLLFY